MGGQNREWHQAALLVFQFHRKTRWPQLRKLFSHSLSLVSMACIVLHTHMKNGNDIRAASPYINYVHHWASVWQKQVPSLLNNYYWCFGMHRYLLLGTSKSLVAKGNRVPQLFPWATIFVVLVQGLQVRRQDQTSERHTYMVPVWNTLEHLQGPP